MDIFWINWALLFVVFGLPLISPGPDFVVSVRNSILYSRMTGIYTAIGLMAGISVHVTYTLLGIATLIAQSVILFNILKYVGAAYLLYIGIKALRSKGFDENNKNYKRKEQMMSPWQAIGNGFLTNLLNPKATLFFVAIFSQFITAETTMLQQVIYGATCVIMKGVWFSFIAIFLTNPKIKATFLKFTKSIDRICGCLLIALSIKLAFSKGVSS